MDANAVSAAPRRNAPCPCGSGKRYKDCHGALVAPSDRPARDIAMRQRMEAAAAAQRAGSYAEAIALYESVLATSPRTFGAVHMLGVVHYQRGEFARAHELVRSALAIMPADAGARYNLRLIESALQRRAVERTICAETLPRLGGRCIAPTGLADRRRWRGAALDVIVSKASMVDAWSALHGFVHWLEAAPTLWLYPQTTPPAAMSLPMRTIDPNAGAIPGRHTAIFFGADLSPARWYERAPAIDVALYCDDGEPCRLVDRIPELAREGRTPLHLLFASHAVARQIGLAGSVVDPSSAE